MVWFNFFLLVHILGGKKPQMGLVNAARRLDFPFLYRDNSFCADKNLPLSFLSVFLCTSVTHDREATVSLSITVGLWGWKGCNA